MKTSTILAYSASLAAAAVAFFLLQVSFEISVSILFAAGLVGITLADYASLIEPAAPARAVLPVEVPRVERYRLAA